MSSVAWALLLVAGTTHLVQAQEDLTDPIVNEPSTADLAGLGTVRFRLYASANPPHWTDENIRTVEHSLRDRMVKGGIPIAASDDGATATFLIGAYVRYLNNACVFDLTSHIREPVTVQRSESTRVVFADTWEGKFTMGAAFGRPPEACWALVTSRAEQLTDHFIARYADAHADQKPDGD